jgi:hypothetical protein
MSVLGRDFALSSMLGDVSDRALLSLLSLESRRVPPRALVQTLGAARSPENDHSIPIEVVRLSSMNSIGSAHADEPAPPPVFCP